MKKKSVIKPLSIALGTVFTVSLANIPVTSAAENPFSMQPISGGYMMLAEGKCGAGMSKGGDHSGKMSKGGEGKCGMARMDADGDGNITRDEFMKGHAAKFDMIDKNGDGVIDPAEREAHMKMMKGMMQDGKCGGSK